MAINFLNTVNLNQNQLVSASIENLPNDPTTNGVLGQLIFNTTSNTLKVCTTAYVQGPPVVNSVYTEVGGGVETLTLNDSTYIDVNSTGTAADPIFAPDLSAVDGTSDATTRFLSKDNTWDVPVVDNYTSWTVRDSAGADKILTSLQFLKFTTATGALGTALTGAGSTADPYLMTLTSPDDTTTYSLPVSAGTAVSGHSVADIDLTDSTPTIISKITYAGLDNQIKITETTGNNGIINIALANGAYDATPGNGTNLELPDGAVAITQATGDNTTKVATTAFVQASVTGLLEFKGGFDADTGAIVGGGNLTDGAARVAVAVGDYYVVTVLGDFFGNTATPLTPGDSVIVQTAAIAGASTEADFIIIQSDTDLATATTPGLGFVTATSTSGIDVSYAANNGSAALTLDACELPSSTALPVELVGCDSGGTTKKFPIDNVVGVRGIKIELTVTTGITKATAGGVTTYSLTLADVWKIGGVSAGVDGTNVQVEVTGAGQTVYADVNRSATVITIGFTGTITDGDYFVLLNNVG